MRLSVDVVGKRVGGLSCDRRADLNARNLSGHEVANVLTRP